MLKFSLYLRRDTKNEQRKLREVLCLQALRHASRARRIKQKNVGLDVSSACVCVCVLAKYLKQPNIKH